MMNTLYKYFKNTASYTYYQTRFYSIKKKKQPQKIYSDTILLPKTKFPQWIIRQKRVENDEHILKSCGFNELYSWQRSNKTGQEFILHDGPPYANGSAHMGHALNKILKDIINRHKFLQGYKIHYTPGWDCHGLPIELKALAGNIEQNLSPLEIRQRARKFAEQAIDDQKTAFKSWGIMADWENECYFTFDPNYINNQLQQFYKLFDMGLIYRANKPVYWSPSTGSALAESELVYNTEHRSTAWTVRLPITCTSNAIAQHLNTSSTKLYGLIWTTTPWTLPANLAIAFNQDLNYSLVRFSNQDDVYIVAEALISRLETKLNRSCERLCTISGEALKGCYYKHPLIKDELLPFLHGDHVNADSGTGLVHSAPAHGHEDFLLALTNNISFTCLVNEKGKYSTSAGSKLANLPVLSEKTEKVLSSMLKDNILAKEQIVHSYPYDWRTNTPVIIRASKQWFIKTDVIKDKALVALENVNILPSRSIQGMINQIGSRPYWCISRQRCWGVPIPVLYKKSSDEYIITRDLINHYCNLVKQKGGDFWWSLDLPDLLPQNVIEHMNLEISDINKSQDILDIWLDSGLSWSSVLGDRVADLYLEGSDQTNGWFQSSLLTAVALTGSAPYKNVYVHGFTLDSQGRKMSKSVGNVIDPQEIVRGSDSSKENGAKGIDILRWWVAAHGSQHNNVPISHSTLDNSSDSVKKLRNIFKFLLGSIHDLPKEYIKQPSLKELSIIDIFLLHSLANFLSEVDKLYESFQLNWVCSKVINFVTNEISSLYFVTIKDKLYCNEEASVSRRNIQFTMYHILNSLAKAVAPIIPVLVEEVFMYHPHNEGKLPFFQSKIEEIPIEDLPNTKNEIDRIMEKVFEIKEEIIQECPANAKTTQLWCNLIVDESVNSVLKLMQKESRSSNSELVDILQVSGVTLLLNDNVKNFKLQIASSDYCKCPRCWRYTSDSEDELCERCNIVLSR